MTSKYTVCIDSSSRDMIAYPNRSEFRIKLPDSYRNVIAVSCELIVLPNYPGAFDLPYVSLHIEELRDSSYILTQNTYTREPFGVYPLCKACHYHPTSSQTPPPNPCEKIEANCDKPDCIEPTCCGEDSKWGWICLDKPIVRHSYPTAFRKLEYLTLRLAKPDGTPINLGKDNILKCSPKVNSQWLIMLQLECTNALSPACCQLIE
jgi:hypothetical protein